MINLLGWLGNIGFILGAIDIGHKKMSGWYWQIFANACYVIVGIATHLNSLWILSLILIGINIYGAYKWTITKNCKQ